MGECFFVFPLCAFSLSLFCKYMLGITDCPWGDRRLQIMIVLRANVEDGCITSVRSLPGGLEDTCTVNVSETDGSAVQNTATDIITGVAADACGLNETVAIAIDDSATAIAIAMAHTIADISASCLIQSQMTLETTVACVVSEANINATAAAVATAVSFGFAGATSTCDPPLCDASAGILIEAISEVLASTTSAALVAQCSRTGDQFSITILEEEIVSASITALSTIITQATVIGGVCDIDATAEATTIIRRPSASAPTHSPVTTPTNTPATVSAPQPVPTPPLAPTPQPAATLQPAPALMPSAPTPAPSPALPQCLAQCARNNRPCDGLDFDTPAACCSPDHLCVRRNSRFSQCRLNGQPGFGTWEGTITMCKA